MPSERTATILVVEDDAFISTGLNDALCEGGFSVLTATNGPDAIVIARDNTPDLILMDISLQGEMTGIEAAARIVQTADTPIIYLTAHSDSATVDLSEKTRPYGYILKPFRDQEVLIAVRMALYRHRAEKALREATKRLNKSNLRFKELVENISGIFWVADPATRFFIYVSPSIEKIAGITVSEAQSDRQAFRRAVLPDDWPTVEAFTQRLINGQGKETCEFRIRRPDGAVRWLSVNAGAVREAGGPAGNFFGFAEDVTDRKEAEEYIRWQLAVNSAIARLFRPLIAFENSISGMSLLILEEAKSLTSSPHGFVGIIDPESGNFLSHTLTNMFEKGCDMPEAEGPIVLTVHEGGRFRGLLGKTLDEAKSYVTNDTAGDPLYRGVPEGHIEVERYLAAPAILGDRTVGMIACANAPRDYGDRDVEAIERLAGYFALAIQRNRAEKATRESEKKFRSTFEHSGLGMAMISPEGYWIAENQKLCAMLGYSPAELTGIKAIDITHPEDVKAARNLVADLTGGRIGNGVVDSRLIRKDGAALSVQATVSLIREDNGSPAYFIMAIEDISRRKSMEKILVDSRIAAEAANNAKSQFLANMSHELRTPLNAILGFTQILESEKNGTLNEKQKDYLRYISESGQHLLDMVNDILDLARIEAGRDRLARKHFDIRSLLERIPVSLGALAAEKAISLESAIDPDTGWINGDEIKIKQVVYNLLSNAIKFTPPGKRIGISSRGENTSVIITVWDEGVGIPETAFSKIFDPFEQTPGRDMQSRGGSGLGLAIAKRIIEMHMGTITVSSELRKGTKFSVILPGRIAGDPGATAAELASPQKGNGTEAKKKRLLVVEDNMVNMKLITELLDIEGYHYEVAESGETALKLMKTASYDAALIDIQLPGMDGVELLGLLRSRYSQRVPAVAMTAYAMKGDREKYLSLGFDGYIGKPIDILALRNTLDALLSEEVDGRLT